MAPVKRLHHCTSPPRMSKEVTAATSTMGKDTEHHAEKSNFKGGISKAEAYEQVLMSARGLFDGERNWLKRISPELQVCNLANVASLLWHAYKALPAPASSVNWAGFYVLDPQKQGELVLGPFHGKVACQRIRIGTGVCGAAAAARETVLVLDVDAYPGHIACDGESRSEIVVPILESGSGRLLGVLDIDCAVVDGFDAEDKEALEKLTRLIADACDW